MEDIISAVRRGCALSHALESDLNRDASVAQLLDKCEEVTAVFTAAMDGLRAVNCHVSLNDKGIQEDAIPIPLSKGKEVVFMEQDLVGGGSVDEGGGGQLRLPRCVNTGGGSSGGDSIQKSRKRKDEAGKRTIEVSAPLHGNTDIPPDDGYTWRKYGQKEILGAQHPRGYYRCTHQKLYNCPAKKQVQRMNNNPNIFQVAYRADHTCHVSSTAPVSSFPPPPPATSSLPSWFPVEHLASQYLIGMTSSMSTTTAMSMPIFLDPDFNHVYAQHQLTDTNNVRSGGATSSEQGDGCADVVGMADEMFNAATAGTAHHSIDFIFSNWETPETSN